MWAQEDLWYAYTPAAQSIIYLVIIIVSKSRYLYIVHIYSATFRSQGTVCTEHSPSYVVSGCLQRPRTYGRNNQTLPLSTQS